VSVRPQYMDGRPVAPWIAARLRWARSRGWTGRVTSGYRPDAEQRRLYDEWVRGIRPGPVAQPGRSNHRGLRWPLGAVDVTQPEQLASILTQQPRHWRRLRWFGPGDRWHFSSSGR
jgi:hypothetical protein